jgi:opacity protein-like surface antigen
MKKALVALAILGCIVSASKAHAADITGKLGLNYTVGPSFIIGGSNASDVARVGPHVGVGLEYGLVRSFSANFAYDDLDNGFQTQMITFGGTFRPALTLRSIAPFFSAGVGFGHRYSGDSWGRFAMTLSAGAEHFFTDTLSAAALFSYHYVAGPNNDGIGDIHGIEPGVRMNYYFPTTWR